MPVTWETDVLDDGEEPRIKAMDVEASLAGSKSVADTATYTDAELEKDEHRHGEVGSPPASRTLQSPPSS